MIAAFFCIAIYIGFVDIGSQWIEPPTQLAPATEARSVPEPKGVAVPPEGRRDEVALRGGDR